MNTDEQTLKLNNLMDKGEQRDKALLDLKKSFALQQLWPAVFDEGAAKSQWSGKQPFFNRDPEHLNHILTVTNGAGEKREFSYEQVPTLLGGGLKHENV